MNLVEQQNMLRELSDGQLSQAMNSGVAPQYLVVAEAKRREDARKRYAALKQKYDASQGTIAEQVLGGLGQSMMGMMGGASGAAPAPGGMPQGGPPGGLDMAMPPPMSPDAGLPGGLDAALPPDMGPQGFARGGAVHRYAPGGAIDTGSMLQSLFGGATAPAAAPVPAVGPTAMEAALSPLSPISYTYPEFNDPYAGLRDLYASQIGELDAERERAGALALISAGLGIAGGKSQNFARNLAGAQDAIKGYGEQMGDIEARRQALMQGQAGIAAQSQALKQNMQRDFESSPEGRRQILENMGVDINTPQAQEYITGGGAYTAPETTGTKYRPGVGAPLDGYDSTTKRPMQAWYNPDLGRYEDKDGNPVPNFVEASESQKLAIAGENKALAAQQPTPTTYRGDVANLSDTVASNTRLTGKIQQSMNLIQNNNFTGLFSLTKEFPAGSWQQNLQGNLRTIISNIGLDRLQELRAQSADGSSGLGQLTGPELAILQDSIASLNMGQTKEQLVENLQLIQENYARVLKKYTEMFKQKYSELGDMRNPEFERNLGVYTLVAPEDEGGITEDEMLTFARPENRL